jgi:hypothetical protein
MTVKPAMGILHVSQIHVGICGVVAAEWAPAMASACKRC